MDLEILDANPAPRPLLVGLPYLLGERLARVSGWRRLLLLFLPPLLGAGLVAGALFMRPGQSPAAPAPPPVAEGAAAVQLPPPSGLLVYVSGAVAHPGLYRLTRGDRVYDAVTAAGGLTADADPARMPNLAGTLKDGEQIKVASLGSSAASASKIVRVSLSTATVEQLAAVPGFTADLAQAVVDYRTTYGPLGSVAKLVTLLGMSQDG